MKKKLFQTVSLYKKTLSLAGLTISAYRTVSYYEKNADRTISWTKKNILKESLISIFPHYEIFQ